MNNSKGKNRSLRRGAVLIIAVVFVAIFSSFGLAMLTMSSTNVQVADNHYTANRAFESAQSGLDVMRYWLGRVAILGDVSPANRFTYLANHLVDVDLATAGISAGKTYDDSGDPVTVNLDNVAINSLAAQCFSASVQKTADLDIVQLDITGSTDSISRTISANYRFETREHNVFDYGVATKGPLSMLGNVEMSGTNVHTDSDVYIESSSQNEALSIIGNSQIAGDVTITNPDAYVTLQGGQAGIGGEFGEAALDHVSVGNDPVEFPVPLTEHFEQYVQNVFDPAVHDTTTDNTFENIRIPGGTNPTFSGSTTLNGIIFIETPNIVTFTGNVDITGIIVGDGDMYDNSGANQIIFLGNVSSSPVTALDEMAQQFDGIRDETGTFLMAPGFSAAFGGNFDTLNGAIAANGINFFGNAGGTINGSIVNYSDTPMMLGGNNDLFFNRSSDTEVPAGFEAEIILNYVPASYSEVLG